MPVDATELGELPIFGMLSTSELETLAAGAERIEVGEPGIELTRQGDFGHSVFVVLEGRAQVAIEGRVVRELSVGDLFGEVAVLSSGRRTATVVSSTKMVLRQRLQARRVDDRGEEPRVRRRIAQAPSRPHVTSLSPGPDACVESTQAEALRISQVPVDSV